MALHLFGGSYLLPPDVLPHTIQYTVYTYRGSGSFSIQELMSRSTDPEGCKRLAKQAKISHP